MDLRFEFGAGRAGKRTRVLVALEQCGRDGVDEDIGGLRRQNGRNQQLKRSLVIELGVGVRMLRLQLVEKFASLARLFHQNSKWSGVRGSPFEVLVLGFSVRGSGSEI